MTALRAAFRNEHSQGRRYPEPPHPYRAPFERDRDRVIHSRAFRRLENKTQVFTRRYSDHFRNRLTHTIEVAQIARTVASALGLNASLAETLALAHDVGHPPFGHTGERALDEAMRRHGSRFEHNLHALRIVESFEQRYAGFPGLNLTFEVREGILKHSRDYAERDDRAYAEYRLSERPPLEAQLIDFVDEIAYSTADLDDGYEAKLLEAASMSAASPLFARHFAAAAIAWPEAPEKLRFNEALKRVLDALATDLIETTWTRVTAAGVEAVEDVRAYPARLTAFSAAMDTENRALKTYLKQNLYQHPSLASERESGSRMVLELFDHFVDHPRRLPASYQAEAEREPVYRVVCDYLAGMTDSYLVRVHEEQLG